VQRLKTGGFGEVYMSRDLCFKWRDTIGRTPVSPVPQGVDYDLWTGPAPKREFTKNRFHYNWHWFWDTGNGDLGNQGIHEVDIARWGLGVTHPTRVSAIGGKFMFDDDQETPNTITATYEFDLKAEATSTGLWLPALAGRNCRSLPGPVSLPREPPIHVDKDGIYEF
jgi:GFO/IDH/MocA oxidoreductase family protein